MNAKEIEEYLLARGYIPEWVNEADHDADYTRVRIGGFGVQFVQAYIACGSVGITTHIPEELVVKCIKLLEKAVTLNAPVFVYSITPSSRSGLIIGDLLLNDRFYAVNDLEDYADVLEYSPVSMQVDELNTPGKRIQYARMAAGLSVEDFANSLGLATIEVALWEEPEHEISIIHKQVVADLLKMDAKDLEA